MLCRPMGFKTYLMSFIVASTKEMKVLEIDGFYMRQVLGVVLSDMYFERITTCIIIGYISKA